jgi:hypothetical protein
LNLARSSREAILKAGISESYFDKHFKLVSVFNKPADHRVVWKFAVNEYEAIISDAIGSYSEGSEVKFTHSVSNTLPVMTEITRTIPRRRAEQAMRACIGRFTTSAVELGSLDQNGGPMLFLTAAATHKPMSAREESRERKQEQEKRSKEREVREGQPATHDVIEEEDEGGRPVVLGAVNLQTGKCTKGKGIAGPPVIK